MPIERCKRNGKLGYRFGKSGKCNIGPGARAKAQRQERAIRASGFMENEDAIRPTQENHVPKLSVYRSSGNNAHVHGGKPKKTVAKIRRNSNGVRSSIHLHGKYRVRKRTNNRRRNCNYIPNAAVRKSKTTHVTSNQTFSPTRADPSRTLTLRRSFQAELRRRFNRLRRQIIELVVTEDAFGLLQRQPFQPLGNVNDSPSHNDLSSYIIRESNNHNPNDIRDTSAANEDRKERKGYRRGTDRKRTLKESQDVNSDDREHILWDSNHTLLSHNVVSGRRAHEVRNGILNESIKKDLADTSSTSQSDISGHISGRNTLNQQFAFASSPEQLRLFQVWLAQQVQENVISEGDAFWEEFVQDAFERGAGRAFDDTNRARRAQQTQPEDISFFEGTREQFLQQSFGQPETVEKVQLLASRVFTELRGVTEQMSQGISRALVDGLAQGQNPRTIAREMTRQVDITRGRAERIARTEIIRAHAEGQLDSLERMGLEEVGVAVEWNTAGDSRVCPLCQPMEGVTFSLQKARGLIPRHPNCRCAFVPANVGESTIGQTRGSEAKKKALERSIRAEIPESRRRSRSLETQKRRSTWPGATRRISKSPEGIL